jgi:hypothetical protein
MSIGWSAWSGRERRAGSSGCAKRWRSPVATRSRSGRGDLLDDLAAVVSDAPRDVTLVVFHTAVLAYVDADKRAAFADAVGAMGVTASVIVRSRVG